MKINQTVPFFDLKRSEIIAIPAAELGPGYILTTIVDGDGVEHEVYLDGVAAFKEAIETHGILGWLARIKRTSRRAHQRKNLKLLTEIVGVWRGLRAYRDFKAGRKLKFAVKFDILNLLKTYSVNGRLAIETTDLEVLSQEEARRLLDLVERKPPRG